MVRMTLLWMAVAGLAAYSFRDWYKSLCGLILLLAVVEHPDFPKSIMGLQGLNPWNILLLVIVIAWANSRKIEKLQWDMPRLVTWLLAIYLAIVLVSISRFIINPSGYADFVLIAGGEYPSTLSLISEYLINCLKWVVPGVLLFDGCRSEERLRFATITVISIYVLLAIQVIRWVPFEYLADGDELQFRALKIISGEIGFHRVNMSMMLAGGSWALYCARDMVHSRMGKILLLGLCGITFFGMALTGGRMGYATWAVLGILFAILRWRRLLLIGPAVLAMFILFVPAIQDRFIAGFTPDTVDSSVRIAATGYQDGRGPDLYTVTSGRAFMWPFVIEEIAERPLIGHGREAMLRTGLGIRIWKDYGESFPHPHNAYLQWMHDNGVLGILPIILFYFLTMKVAASLFMDKDDPVFRAIGGVTLALVGALLIAAMGSQSFYPREGSLPMWCAMGLSLRCYIQRGKWLESFPIRSARNEQYSPAV